MTLHCRNHPGFTATHVAEMPTPDKQPDGRYFADVPLCQPCATRVERMGGFTLRPGDVERGWWNLSCWNALSERQQRQLIEVGTLSIGEAPAGGTCTRGAEVCVETMHDEAPGPRFYCAPCAVAYITTVGS